MSRARVTELLATGAWTPLLLAISWLVRRALPLDDAELAIGFLMFHAAHVVNDPHFAVTYLLFYDDALSRSSAARIPIAQRVRWLVAGVLVPIVLVGWAMWALASHAANALGAMVQLMNLAVGWHYGKQGFGVLTVLSARRGVSFDPIERRVLLFHVYATWALAWSSPPLRAGEYEERGVVYWALARPEWLMWIAVAVCVVSTAGLAVVLVKKLRREGALPWTPLLAYLATLWLWSVAASLDPLVRYVIPALHALQYFFFVGLLRWNEARSDEGPPRFGRPATSRLLALAVGALLLGYALFRGIPAVLDAELVGREGWDALGATPFFAAFYVVVNLHHFAMDAVIWRREHAPTRYLVAKPPALETLEELSSSEEETGEPTSR